MARFQEVKITQPGDLSTQAASGLMSLGEKLDQFGAQIQQQRLQRVTTEAEKAGVEAGQALGEDQQPEFREVGFIGSARDEAYNKGLRAAYVAGLDRDIREEVARIQSENPDNLLQFNDQVNSFIKSTLQGVDPSVKALATEKLDAIVSNAKIKVQAGDIARNKKAALGEISTAVDAAVNDALTKTREGDESGAAEAAITALTAIDQGVESGLIAPEIAAERKREINKGIVEQRFKGELDGIAEEDMVGAFDRLDEMAGEIPKGFTPDEWDSFIASEQKRLNRTAARQNQEATANAKLAKEAASTERGKLFLDPAVPADPAKGSQDRKDVNLYYESIAPELSTLPIQEQVNRTVEFINNTGIVPNQVISASSAAMRSGTPEQVALMSDMLSRLQEESPATLKDIPEETRAISLQVSDAVKAGVPVEVAMEQARKFAFGMTAQEKEAISLQSQEHSKSLNGNLQSMVNSDLDQGGFDKGVLYGVPDVSSAMLGEFRTSFDRFMKMTGGNPDQSQKLAYQAVRSTWGVTETGGNKRFMKYAPEAVYKVQGYGDDWIENQFNAEMEAIGAEGALITIDHTTAREEQPSYPVLTTDENGILVPLLDESNMPMRWRPDFKATPQYKAITDMPGEKIEKAKKQRKVNQERRANEIRRGIHSRVFSTVQMPFSERKTFFSTDEGKDAALLAINNMVASGKINEVEANEARKAFEVN